MQTAYNKRPAAAVREEVAALREEIGVCTVSKYPRSSDCYAARERLEARMTLLMEELVPEGLDARFVTTAAVTALGDDVLDDLLAAARWAADIADRASYSGVADGDSALDSIDCITAVMRGRGRAVPEWR